MKMKALYVVAIAALLGSVSWWLKDDDLVESKMEDVFGWSEADKQSDPIGFVNHAEGKLKEKLEAMRESQSAMTIELAKIEESQREIVVRKTFAEQQAVRFRRARAQGKYPVVVFDEAYPDVACVESQLALLLAELDGYEQTLQEIEKLRTVSEDRLAQLTVQVNTTAAHLQLLGLKRELIASDNLADSSTRFIEEVDQLVDANQQIQAVSPVRNVNELLAAMQSEQQPLASRERLMEFLAQDCLDSREFHDDERCDSDGQGVDSEAGADVFLQYVK